MEFLAMHPAEHTEIALVQSEYGFNPFPVGQVHQGCIGKLDSQPLIFGENRGDSGKVRLVKRNKVKRPAVERG